MKKVWITAFVIIMLSCNACYCRIKNETLHDGVKHYSYYDTNIDVPFLYQMEKIYNLIFPYTKPFGKSIALLVGASNYKYITPSLPSVKNDIEKMRLFLLNDACFDDVYIIENDLANRDMIEKYVKSILPKKFNDEDRFLFYFSGHGDSNQGRTGYMQFSKAEPNYFGGPNVLAINDVEDWSSEINFKHMLFIFDCCASGLALTTKKNSSDENELISTLSGNGSRIIITAGSSDQKAFAVQKRKESGYGVFTKAFLSAFKKADVSFQLSGMITISEVFASIEKDMGFFSNENSSLVTPMIRKMQEDKYIGTFIFLNPHINKSIFSDSQKKALNIAKGGDSHESAILEIVSYIDAIILANNSNIGDIKRGETKTFYDMKPDNYKIKMLSANEMYEYDVTLEKGTMERIINIGDFIEAGRSRYVNNSNIEVGNINLFSFEYEGEIYINNVQVGYLKRNQNLKIKNVIIGTQEVMFVDPENSRSIFIKLDKEKDVNLEISGTNIAIFDNTPPAAPTGVQVIQAN